MARAEATRQRILDAAFTEFSSHGLAGARVDRIAAAAGCNKNLLYVYFQNKETLYRTVLARTLEDIYGSLWLKSGDDLADLAGQLFDFSMQQPQSIRLLARAIPDFASLLPPDSLRRVGGPVDVVARAQADGVISSRFSADYLLASVLALASCWTPVFPFGQALEPTSSVPLAEIRESVVRTVRLMLSDPPSTGAIRTL